jgi:hypothetical protein
MTRFTPKLAQKIRKGIPSKYADELDTWMKDPTVGKPYVFHGEGGAHISMNKTDEYGARGLRIDSVATNADVKMGDITRQEGLGQTLAGKMLAYAVGTNPYPITIAGSVKNRDMFERMAKEGNMKYDALRESALISDIPLGTWWKTHPGVKRLQNNPSWEDIEAMR